MDKSKPILIMLVINALAVVYIGYTLHSAVRSSNAERETEFRMLQQQVQQLEHDILSSVRHELMTKDDVVKSFDYAWTDVNIEQKQAKIELQVELTEVAASAEIAVTLNRESEGEPLQVALEPQGGMRYGAGLELSVEHNYEISVWERSESGQRLLNAGGFPLSLHDELYIRRVKNVGGATSTEDERMATEFFFELEDPGIPGAGLEKVLLQVKKDGAVYDEIDLTEQAVPRPAFYRELENHYNMAIASGQIDESVTLEQFASDQGILSDPQMPTDETGESSSTVEYVIPYTIHYATDYPELELDGESVQQLDFEWQLHFEDGYVWPHG
ncbi:hypothetical protein [Paenibacillus daejeonensis]|uniref:hypothetical protein n=1 Tax=Paenibacillus daejeonensis TaxID=135193 RepID=UPI00037D066B|nr:hypothetical protein [Paenibacillus daejeonensis]